MLPAPAFLGPRKALKSQCVTARGRNRVRRRAGTATAGPAPTEFPCPSPTSSPLHARKPNRTGRTGMTTVTGERGRLDRTESDPVRKTSFDGRLAAHSRRRLAGKNPQELRLQSSIRRRRHLFARVHQDIPTTRQVGAVAAKNFPQPPLHPIAQDSIAQANRRGDPQARMRQPIGADEYRT